MANNTILIAGNPSDYRSDLIQLYEAAVSDAVEFVTGRVGCLGTATNQAKLYATGSVPLFLFDFQRYASYVSGVVNMEYATDDKPVDTLLPLKGPIVAKGVLNDGEVVAILDLLDAENATGKLVKHVAGGFACAIALVASSPSGADDTDFLCLFFGPLLGALRMGSLQSARVTTETVTVTTNVGTLTNTPLLVESVQISAGTATKACAMLNTTQAVNAGEVFVLHASKTLTFNASDAATAAKVRYWY